MRKGCLLLPVGVLLAGPVQAHGALPGGGGFYAGIAHPFLAWEHLLLVLALGLLLGRHTHQTRRPALITLAAAVGIGLSVQSAGFGWQYGPAAILALGVVLGGLVAADLRLPASALTVLAVLSGAMIGLDTGMPAPSSTNVVAISAPYAGVFVGIFLILLNAVALSTLAKRPPYTIGVRIVGSWIVAACLMVLALTLRQIVGEG